MEDNKPKLTKDKSTIKFEDDKGREIAGKVVEIKVCSYDPERDSTFIQIDRSNHQCKGPDVFDLYCIAKGLEDEE